MNQIVKYIIALACVLLTQIIFAQPSNDLCENAINISISNNGFDLGSFVGDSVLLDSSTVSKGETCSEEIAELGNCGKTVWYTFYVATARDVAVKLEQRDSSIPQIFVGFTVYRSKDCDYNQGDVSNQLIPLTKFGVSGNRCLQKGRYYVQVSAKTRVKGKIWISLQVDNPQVESYDNMSTPMDLGELKDKQARGNIDVTCLSITPDEVQTAPDSSYGRSAWIKANFGKGMFYNFVNCDYTNSPLAYRIFYGQPNKDSVLSNKPFTHFNRNDRKIMYNELCEDRATSIYIQLLFSLEYDGHFSYSIGSYSEKTDDWNRPAGAFEIEVNSGMDKRYDKYFDCNGYLPTHSCKSVIPDYYTHYMAWQDHTDTFEYATYTVLKSKKKGELSVHLNDERNYGYNVLFILYEGNITSTCDLKEISRSNGLISAFYACLDSGEYTLVMVKNHNVLYGNYVNVRVRVVDVNQNINYYSHTDPLFIGNVKPSENKEINTGNTVHIHHIDTTIVVDTVSITGRLIFREMYVDEDCDLEVIVTNTSNFQVHVFSGRFSDNSIKLKPGFNYFNSYFNTCQSYKKGYYTIVTQYDSTGRYPYLKCHVPNNIILVKKAFTCGNNPNLEAINAELIYGGGDVLTDMTSFDGMSYVYPLKPCWDCLSKTNTRPSFSCHLKTQLGHDSTFQFYTFYLGKNAEVNTPYNTVLYKGNARTNASICTDTNNIVDPCNYGNTYCNLEGNTFYTLVLAESYGGGYKNLIVTPHEITPNNFAKNAFDFGVLEDKKFSKTFPMTCHTTAFKTDPCDRPVGLCEGRSGQTQQFPDTINRKRSAERRNLWYTFTVTGDCEITANVLANEFCRERIFVFKSTDQFESNYSNVVLNGLDSTNTGMELIASNRGKANNCNYSYLQFRNNGCSYTRYFVLIESYTDLPNRYRLELTRKVISFTSDKGDYCDNAVRESFFRTSTYNISVNNYCHTYGGSPFEDTVRNDLISTWIRVDVDRLKKFDIAFRYVSNNVRLQKYNVYAGSCGALTKVASLVDGNAYFTLSCMGEGTYYIQAITSSHDVGKLTFQVEVTESNQACKPYDFKQPIAHYDIFGGCMEDSFVFNNISTQGDDIEHNWYLNGAFVSNDLHLDLWKHDTRLNRMNDLMLIVTNNKSTLKDTIIKKFENDTTHYALHIKPPEHFRCFDTIQLATSTNYPHKINYLWEPLPMDGNPYNPNPSYFRVSEQQVTVTGTSDNCIFKDTINLKSDPTSGLFSDTTICNGSLVVEYDIKPYLNFRLNGVYLSEPIMTLHDSGTYYLDYIINGCHFRDTLLVSYGPNKSTTYEFDTLNFCKGDEAILTYPNPVVNPIWSTGSNKDTIGVVKPGSYILKASLKPCQLLEYEVKVEMDSFPDRILTDSAVCAYDWYFFKNPVGNFEVLSKQPPSDSVRIVNDVNVFVELKNGNCMLRDSALIKVINISNQVRDSLVCFDTDLVEISLDGLAANEYNWLHLNHYDRFLTVNSYDTFSVARVNDDNCLDTVSYQIVEKCPINQFYPTSFSPNGDGVNDTYGPQIAGAYDRFDMMIANRWGEIIFNTHTSEMWDGSYKNEIVQNGSYLVIIRIYNGTERIVYKGTVTVLR